MDNIYYVISNRKVTLKNVGLFCTRYFEILLHVDMYLQCEYFHEMTEEKHLGCLEVSVNECDGTTTENRLDKFVQEAIKSYGKIVLGGSYKPVIIKNDNIHAV